MRSRRTLAPGELVVAIAGKAHVNSAEVWFALSAGESDARDVLELLTAAPDL